MPQMGLHIRHIFKYLSAYVRWSCAKVQSFGHIIAVAFRSTPRPIARPRRDLDWICLNVYTSYKAGLGQIKKLLTIAQVLYFPPRVGRRSNIHMANKPRGGLHKADCGCTNQISFLLYVYHQRVPIWIHFKRESSYCLLIFLHDGKHRFLQHRLDR